MERIIKRGDIYYAELIIQSFKKKQGSSCRRAERKCSNFDPFT